MLEKAPKKINKFYTSGDIKSRTNTWPISNTEC